MGFGLTISELKADLNFYMMDFSNEIVNNGQLDNVGQPIAGNAGKSIHRGIEVQLAYQPFKKMYGERSLGPLTIEGNLNISDNYFTEYTEVLGADSLGNIIYGNDYSDNQILLNPGIIANLSLNYFAPSGLGAFVSMQHIGKQYLDNSQNERKNPDVRNQPGYVDKVIEPYTVFNAGISLNLVPIIGKKNFGNVLSQLEANFKVNNIFDVLYETTGSVDSNGTPYWIPAAERNFYFDIKVGF
jgi:iron complex outermembrane receptor protein